MANQWFVPLFPLSTSRMLRMIGRSGQCCTTLRLVSHFLPVVLAQFRSITSVLRETILSTTEKLSQVYPEPFKFNPDRFLTGEGRTPQLDPREVAFGFGRR
jgi:hypothetical protein